MSKERSEPWWKRWVVAPVRKQLEQGVSAEKLSWAVAVGCVMGVFPIMGTTSLVTLSVAWTGQLNKPVALLFAKLMLPLHLALILVFIRLGQRLHGFEPLSSSIPDMLSFFQESPRQFVQDFSLAAWHGVVAWALICSGLLFVIRGISLPILRRLSACFTERKEVVA